MSEQPNFEGIAGGGCEHRTVGPDRAWCLDCREWCYPNSPCVRCDLTAPVDWPARFRKAADVAEKVGGRKTAAYYSLNDLAAWCEVQPPHVVEAIGRALLEEES